MSTIFGKIIRKEIPAKIVYEDDLCLAFKDIHPQAPVHILLIPKKEIRTLTDATVQDQMLLGHMMVKVGEIAKSQGLGLGYKVQINCGENGGQEVDHLHLHILGRP